MNYIIIILCSIILPIFSFKETKPKLCIDCKHFLTDNDTGKFGKCSLSPKAFSKNFYFVNGVFDQEEYHYCYLSRTNNDICGEDGKMYKKKYKKRSPEC
jgi:predicted ATPase